MTSLPIEGVPPGRPSGETRWQSLVGTDRSDHIYRRILTGFALGLPLLILVILGVLFTGALPALKRFGPAFRSTPRRAAALGRARVFLRIRGFFFPAALPALNLAGPACGGPRGGDRMRAPRTAGP